MRAAAASFDIYRGAAPWLGNGGCGLELASGISSELARLTLTEFSCGFQRSRAGRFLENALSPFLSRLRIYTEYACATGGVMFKPGYDGKALSCECILPFDFIPLGTDGAGEITDCAFLYYFRDGGQFYTRIETHRRAGGGYMVTNRAYRSDRGYGLGDEVPLSSVDGWAGITPDVFIAGLGAPLFAYFGIPLGNAFSPSSPLGVPVFRRAERGLSSRLTFSSGGCYGNLRAVSLRLTRARMPSGPGVTGSRSFLRGRNGCTAAMRLMRAVRLRSCFRRFHRR